MALNKRQYVDGQTIVTAANLNEIQDCIIAIEGAYVPKTRKVAGKALSSDITISASDVGAVPTSRTINAKALTGNITLSAADVGAVPVARTVNGKALSSNITLSAADVSAVPTTRTVNSKALSEDISITASDVGAVPTGRKVNGKALSSDITLAASDVGAVPVARTVNGKALSSNITLSAADVSAVPTTRTVNSKALSADITLASGDIEDDSDAGGATVKASLSSLKGSLQSKTESIDLGTISSTTYPTVAELLEQVFNLVTIYDQPIIVKFSWKGMWQGIVNKYSSGTYGQMLCSHYSDAQDYLCHIVNGNFTVRKISNVLHFNNVTCSAVTGTIITINDDMITSDYVLLNLTFSKPTAISQNLTWNTLSGTFTINGSCTDGTCTASVTIGLS